MARQLNKTSHEFLLPVAQKTHIISNNGGQSYLYGPVWPCETFSSIKVLFHSDAPCTWDVVHLVFIQIGKSLREKKIVHVIDMRILCKPPPHTWIDYTFQEVIHKETKKEMSLAVKWVMDPGGREL